MRIFAIGDLHLSLDDRVEKPMDIFGGEWIGHTEKLYNSWAGMVKPEDMVIICGDISWGLKLEEAMADLNWIHRLPGRKLLFKGNHDLWWKSIGKLNGLYDDGTMQFVQNRCILIEGEDSLHEGDGKSGKTEKTGKTGKTAICGTRGWICPGTEGFCDHDRKIYEREAARLKMSLEDARKAGADIIIGVLHFPPTNDKQQGSAFTDLMTEYGVKTCVYGHLHGSEAFKNGMKGIYNGVEYKLVSLDYLEGKPVRIL